MSAGLDASTVTPGITAPVLSFTTPAMALCAQAPDGSNPSEATTMRILVSDLRVCIASPCGRMSAATRRGMSWLESTAGLGLCQSELPDELSYYTQSCLTESAGRLT